MKKKVMQGKPYAGNPHVRFDEGAGAPRHSGRSALLYSTRAMIAGGGSDALLTGLFLICQIVVGPSAALAVEKERDLSKVEAFEVFPEIQIPVPDGYSMVEPGTKPDGSGRLLAGAFLQGAEPVVQYVYAGSESGNFLDGTVIACVPKAFMFREVARGEFMLAVGKLKEFAKKEQNLPGVDALPSRSRSDEHYSSLVKEEAVSSGSEEGKVYFSVSRCAFWHGRRCLFLLKFSVHGDKHDAIFTAGEQERFLEKWIGEIRRCRTTTRTAATIRRPLSRPASGDLRRRRLTPINLPRIKPVDVEIPELKPFDVKIPEIKPIEISPDRIREPEIPGFGRREPNVQTGDSRAFGRRRVQRGAAPAQAGRDDDRGGAEPEPEEPDDAMSDDSDSDGLGWNAWVDRKLGCMTKERADSFVKILKILEHERKALSEGALEDFDLSKFAVSDVDSMNDLLNAITEKFGNFRYATCEAAFGQESRAERVPSAGLLKITVDSKKKDKPEDVRMWLARVMAGLRYEDVKEKYTLGKEEEKLWDDVCVACSGFGGLTLVSVKAERTFTDDGEQRQLSYVGSMKPVDAAWMYCVVALLRGEREPKAIPNLGPAGQRAFEIGLHQAKANLTRVKGQMTSGEVPRWDESLPETPAEKPLPRRKIKRAGARRPRDAPPGADSIRRATEALKEKVAAASKGQGVAKACLMLAEGEKPKSARRFVLVSEAMRINVWNEKVASARELFERELKKHGADYALALVDPILRSRRKLTKKAGPELAMWMAEVDEMKEAAAFLARNEAELDFLDAPTFLRKDAAERYMVLHDAKNAYEELYRSEGSARRILWNMGCRLTATAQKDAKPGEIADFWWRYADGKRPGVVAFCGPLSDEWYAKALESPGAYPADWLKAAKGRIGKWHERQVGFKTNAEAEFRDDEVPAGNSGLLVRRLEGAWPVAIPALVPLVHTTIHGSRRTETRTYRPYDFWLNRAWVAGWADAFGNRMTIYRIKSLPLRDSDFGEDAKSRPTSSRLEAAIDKSSFMFVKPSRDGLLDWLSTLLECEKQGIKFVTLKPGHLRAARAVTDLEGKPYGVLLATAGGELYFTYMRFPTVSVADAQRLVRKFAQTVKEIRFPKKLAGDELPKGGLEPVSADGWLVYAIPGYLVWTDHGKEAADEMVWRISREMAPVLSMFRRYVPPQRNMQVSTLRIFGNRRDFMSHMKEELDDYGENMIGVWTARRQELLVQCSQGSMAGTMSTVRHEGFHQYLFYATGRNGHAMWFNEGHACLFENGQCWSDGSDVHYEISDDASLRRTRELEADLTTVAEIMPKVLYMDHDEFMSGTLREVNLRYTASWAIVYFLQKAVPALEEYAAYRDVIPTYLDLMKNDSMRPEVATRKAWKSVGTGNLASDFLDFWRDPEKRSKARAYSPEPHE